MHKIYIFDVDGTLTPSRRPMTEEFLEFFNGWSKRNPFYLVSGSDLPKMKEQVPEFILERAEGLFTCGGNQLYRDDELMYEHKFTPPKDLIKYLDEQVRISKTIVKSTNHIEDRGSMINFSTVGRDCTLEERKKYFEWDNESGEREQIAKYIKKQWPELDAVIGGQISIDIVKRGFDKSQVIFEIMYRNVVTSKDNYVFIGDRTMEGGNDYPLAKAMKELGNCKVFQAGAPSAEDGYIKTREILEKLND